MGSIISCAQYPNEGKVEFNPEVEGEAYNCGQAERVKENVNIWIFFPILLCVYTPLVMIRDMKKLAWSHLLSNILVTAVLISVIVFAGKNMADEGATLNPAFMSDNWYRAPSYAAGSFEGVAVLMPMRLIVAD